MLITNNQYNNNVCINEKDFYFKKENNYYKMISNYLKFSINIISIDKNDVFDFDFFALMFAHLKQYQNFVNFISKIFVVAINRLKKNRKKSKNRKTTKTKISTKKKTITSKIENRKSTTNS